ncbi:MAG: SLC13 family permease, partial [Myxococcota bacterium]
MTFAAGLSLGITLLTIVCMVLEVAAPEVLLLGAVTVLMAFGVVTPAEAVGGFGSVAVLTIVALLIVAAGVRRTGVLTYAADALFGQGQSREPLLRVMLPAGALSAFLNNTPIVAIFVPAVLDWCKRNNRAPSRMLMPLSFATIIGGLCTLIGTSTTLVIDGLMQEHGMRGLGMFEIAWVGFPVAVSGILLIWILAPRLLPDRRDPVAALGEGQREFLVEMLVDSDSPLAGRNIAEVGLRNLPGLFLMNIERSERFIGPVSPEEVLSPGDRLVFTGIASTVLDLRRFPGLSPAPEAHYDPTAMERRNRLFEVVISANSPLAGSSLK